MKKKLLLFSSVLILFITTACSLGNTPTTEVEKLLAKYNNQDEEIVVELDDYINDNALTDEQNKKYKDVYLRQFKDMKYEVKEETINGDDATVLVQITVYDYYDVDKEANNYLLKNPDEFKKNNEYEDSLFTNYKLEKLMKTDKTVDYTLEFKLTKVDNKWQVNELTNEQLEKIHGVYKY